MKVYVTRHGQTKYNKDKLLQGLTDEPLNEIGINQAKEARKELSNVKFDACFASPLCRAIKTASIMGGIDEKDVIVDPRIIEIDFGPFELRSYFRMGFKLTLFWILPEVFKAPKEVESIDAMAERVNSFFEELEKKDYENVLIACHGGIIRVICGYLEGRKNKIKWRPKPKNCEVRIYEKVENGYRRILN